jgi:hypothetical protein
MPFARSLIRISLLQTASDFLRPWLQVPLPKLIFGTFFTAGVPAGSRIKDVKINGKAMEADQTYSIGGCEQEGEALDRICRLPGVNNARYVPGTVHGALLSYLKAHSPIDPKREGRVRATDLRGNVWSQYGTLQTLWHIPGDALGVATPQRPKVAK